MGCCGSTEEIEITGMDGASTEKVQLAMMEAEIEEQPDTKSFLATILQARLDASGDAEVMEDCVVRLKEHNSKLKQYIAVLDAQSGATAGASRTTHLNRLEHLETCRVEAIV